MLSGSQEEFLICLVWLYVRGLWFWSVVNLVPFRIKLSVCHECSVFNAFIMFIFVVGVCLV